MPLFLIFSRASAKAERDLSNLCSVFLYVELGGHLPGQDFTGAYHNVTPLLKKISITTDMM